MEKQYSPEAQALLDKMKPLAADINELDKQEASLRLTPGAYEQWRDVANRKQKLIKKLAPIQLKYRKLRAAEEGQEYLGVK